MGGLRLIPQPLVIAFSMRFWVLYNGIAVLNADGIIQPPDRAGAAPEVSEFPVTVHIDCVPDDVVMDMGFVDMGADHKGVISLGEPLCKLHAQPVGFFRGDLTGDKGLPDMVGQYIVRAPYPSSGGNVLTFCQQKLGVGYPAVTRKAGDEPAVVCLLWVGYIVDNVTDRLAFGAAFAGVQRHDACGCHDGILLSELVSFIAINPFGGYNKIKIFLHLKGVPFMIEKWIAEATECDFKVAVEIKKPKSWLKSVSAFSNGIGGTLFFGIDDNQNTVGLPDIQGDAEAISRFIKERITPIPQFVLTPFQEDGKDMLALKIPAGTSTPYYYKADGIMEAYIRVGNESVAAPDYIVNELILKGTHRSFDALVTDAPRKDYSFTLLEATYLERTGLRMELPDYCSFGLADKNGMLTNAGRLLTDQRTVFNSRIFCTRWNGLEKGSIFDDALDDKEYEGSLIYLLQSGCEFIRNNSKVRFAKEAQYRVDKPDYAERAVTEAVVNALIHRDYIVLGSEIHIDMYDDRVEIVSPGGMFEGAPVQECDINTIRSVRRNPVIADLFHRMKYMERRGSGLRKIVSETEKLPGYEEYLKPEFFSTPSDFKVILKNVNYIMSGSSTHETTHDTIHDLALTQKQALLLDFCTEARSRDEMQSFVGITNRSHFSKAYLKPLLASGKLKMTIPDKPKSRSQKYITAKEQ